MSFKIMSNEFDSLATLIRCRVLAAKIANELRNKRPEHFFDKLSLADIHASVVPENSIQADSRDRGES